MKEFESLQQDKKLEAIELVAAKENKKEIRLIDRQRKVRGHILWEFNEATRQLKKAKFKMSVLKIKSLSDTVPTATPMVTVNDNCIYIQALNAANAKKKLINKGYSI